MSNHNHRPVVRADGWQAAAGIPEEDYRDFDSVCLSMQEVRHCLNAGYFPPGLILFDGNTKAMVVGPYMKPQTLRRIMA